MFDEKVCAAFQFLDNGFSIGLAPGQCHFMRQINYDYIARFESVFILRSVLCSMYISNT